MNTLHATVASGKLDLQKVSVLVLDDNLQCQEILVQILVGFGVKKIYRAASIIEAERTFAIEEIDLALVDSVLPVGSGYDFVRDLRRSGQEPNCYVPVIMVTSHTAERKILQARDCGANFTVSKPLRPSVLLQRIAWIARDERKFVKTDSYVGPDRRLKRLGPPAGMAGRRRDDLSAEVGIASEPNMSQSEIDDLMKPQRVSL